MPAPNSRAISSDASGPEPVRCEAATALERRAALRRKVRSALGYPIAVLAGREALMRHVGDGVVHGGTFTGHSVALAAADKTLEILDETDALEAIRNYGLRLQEGLERILDERGIAHSFTGAPALMGLFFNWPVTNILVGLLFGVLAAVIAYFMLSGHDPRLLPSALIDKPAPQFKLPPIKGMTIRNAPIRTNGQI